MDPHPKATGIGLALLFAFADVSSAATLVRGPYLQSVSPSAITVLNIFGQHT